MDRNRSYKRYTIFVFIMTFAVIAAGGIVRMSQSGMGCPDWPTCFGRWIPPITEAQLPANFEDYLSKQDIDHSFNVYHTWTEYINRLVGALLGVFILVHFVWSFMKFRKTRKDIVLLSGFLLITVMFVGWLGKMVVDGNLEVSTITIHMFSALLLTAIPIVLYSRLDADNRMPLSRFMLGLVLVSILLTLVQVYLGTAVREEIDIISKSYKYEQRELWIGSLSEVFICHRSFSWLLLVTGILTSWFLYRKNYILSYLIISILVLNITFGIVMAYFNIPVYAQPLHLLLGCFYLSVLLYVLCFSRVMPNK